MIAVRKFDRVDGDNQALPGFSARKLRRDFPILQQTMHGKPLVYLDSAASAQKPHQVINTLTQFYSQGYANIHRGVYTLSEQATAAYEGARDKIRDFVHARSRQEIVFVRGATEAINLVAASYGRHFLRAGDEIIVTALEHHSNIVPWQLLTSAVGAVLKVAPMNDRGEVELDRYAALFGDKTKFASIVHVSNALGSVNPVKEMIAIAHRHGVPVLIDGAQAVPHGKIDVQDLDCEFYAFSGHKLFGPTGIGVLYGKEDLLEKMPPYQGGGDMIRYVSFEKTLYNSLPFKFEAGTPNIAGVIGLGAAIDYLNTLDWEAIMRHEEDLLHYSLERLRAIPKLRLIGTAHERRGVISFIMDGIHPHDIGTILDSEGIAIRAGHHCAQPIMDRFGVPATARISIACYNTREDIDALVRAMDKVLEVFG